MGSKDGLGLKIPATPAAMGAFLCLLGLCYQAHELGHHLFGAIACGQAGEVTFSTYTAATGCPRLPDLATELFGPAISLAIAYGAAFRLRRRPSLLAFACVFASYFHLRWIPPLLGGGDELDLARKVGFNHGWTIAALLFAIAFPPVVFAWRAAAVRGRWWRVTLAYLLPLPFLFEVDALAARISGPDALVPRLAQIEVLNVPVSLLLIDLALAGGFAVMARRVSRLDNPSV
jgi:hypothetical protein